MNLILRVLFSAIAIFVLSQILPGVEIDSYQTSILVAVVLSLLNFIVKPLLVVLTLPITIITMGLFMLVINASCILLADYFVDGFNVASIWWALLFSLLLSLFQSILFSFLKKDKKS